MSEMVERVARAIRRNKFMRTSLLSAFDPASITEEELGEARAAIEAMREPTNDMINAAYYQNQIIPDRSWSIMIDHALK